MYASERESNESTDRVNCQSRRRHGRKRWTQRDRRRNAQKSVRVWRSAGHPKKTDEVLSHIKKKDRITLVVAPGKMGERHISACNMPFKVIGTVGESTSKEDTKRISKEMVGSGADLLVFVGGDGTARDIYDAIESRVPVVAVPAGVKVFSSVFAFSARAAAEMVDAFVEGVEVTEEEVLDIDEDAFREGRLASRLYGYLRVPDVKNLLQGAKEASSVTGSSVQDKLAVAKYVVEKMAERVLYLLGPGTTLKAIADELGVPKTLLGIDAVFEGKPVGTDVNEKGILDLFNKYEKRKIILTPIGGNGFILGRGSKPEVELNLEACLEDEIPLRSRRPRSPGPPRHPQGRDLRSGLRQQKDRRGLHLSRQRRPLLLRLSPGSPQIRSDSAVSQAPSQRTRLQAGPKPRRVSGRPGTGTVPVR